MEINCFRLRLNFDRAIDFSIRNGECWIITTSDNNLVDSFFGWIDGKKYNPLAEVELISGPETYSDSFRIRKLVGTLRFNSESSDNGHFYYQQRYHATENDDILTLREYLGKIPDPFFIHITNLLGLDLLLAEKINMLSTGEFRKAHLLKTAMSGKAVLFLDDPCTGMDHVGCRLFNRIFEYLVSKGSSVVIFGPGGENYRFRTNFLDLTAKGKNLNSREVSDISIPAPRLNGDFISAFELRNITASYGGHDVLHKVSWRVSRNEKWTLTGHNGAGKSTLLSFIYADNPQVYCNDVFLFGRQRGTGESIWEVKDQKGFYSSELHRYFNRFQTLDSAIDSIVFQNPYEKRILSPEEENFRKQLTEYFELRNFDGKLLYDLPAVIQKQVILIGVLLKNSPLLILDEPFQGFGERIIEKWQALLVRFVSDRTFIMVSHNFSEFPCCMERHFRMESGEGRELTRLPVVD